MGRVQLCNGLDGDVKTRCCVERAVWAVFESLPDGEWTVTLRRSMAPGRIAIDITLPAGGIACMSVAATDTPEEVERQLRLFVTSR